MALPNSRQDREYKKFVELPDGSVAIQTTAQIEGDVNVDNTSLSTDGYIGKPSGENGDFTTAYTAATQVTLSSFPPNISTFYDSDIVAIQQIDNTGEVQNTYTRDDAVMTIVADVVTVTGATFAATDTFVVYTSVPRINGSSGQDGATQIATPPFLNVGGEYRAAEDTYLDGDGVIDHYDINGHKKIVDKAYDSLTQSNKVAEVSPLSSHYVGETLIDETNITTNTTSYAYFDVSGHRKCGLQGETSGAAPTDVLTVTIEATCQDDGTAAASCVYQDVTTWAFDAATGARGTASWVDTDFFAILDEAPFKYVRVKYVTSNGGANDADLTVYTKKLY